MNRRDYRAHVAWAEGIEARRAGVRHVNRPQPPAMKPRKPWRAWFAAVGAAAVVGACRTVGGV